MILHVHKVEKWKWGTQQYFMCMKWKSLTGKPYDISCPLIGKIQLENSIIFHVHEVEKLNRRALRRLKNKVEKLNWSTYYASCSRSGTFQLGNFTVFHVHEVEMFNLRDLRYFNSTKEENFSWGTLDYFMSTKWKTLTGKL